MGKIATYEIRVKTKKNGTKHYSSFLGMDVFDEEIKMFHIDARTPEQAEKKARKHGRPISIRKADVARMVGSIEKLPLEQEIDQVSSSYSSAVAMDEMIWKKKKRRIRNREKDKEGIE